MGEDGAGFVVGEHHGHERRVRTDGAVEFLKVETALVVHTEPGHFVALVLKVVTVGQHRGMFHLGGDDVPLFRLGFRGGIPGGVVGLGTAGSEDDLFRIRIENAGHLLAGLLDVVAHLAAEGVHAGSVAVKRAEGGHHGFHHFGSNPRGGVVVKINHISTVGHVTPPQH